MQFLVIANVAPHAAMEMVELLTQPEARRVWELYTAGLVRSVWYRGDRPGAVLLLECESEAAAKEAAASLPMVEAGLLDVEVIPLGAYDGIASLFAT